MLLENFLKKNLLIEGLDQIDIEILSRIFCRRNFGLGHPLVKQGMKNTPVGIILSGHAHLLYNRPSSNQDVVLRNLEAGDVFGLHGFFSDKGALANVISCAPLICMMIDYDSLVGVLDAQKTIRMQFYETSLKVTEQAFYDLDRMDMVLTPVYDNSNQKIDTIGRSLEYIHANYAQQQTLDDVAKYCGMSKFYFSRLFKDKTGFTYKEYLNRIRINAARTYLLHANLNVSEVCFQVGFNDLSYFCRVFKQVIGVSPRHYKSNENECSRIFTVAK